MAPETENPQKPPQNAPERPEPETDPTVPPVPKPDEPAYTYAELSSLWEKPVVDPGKTEFDAWLDEAIADSREEQ